MPVTPEPYEPEPSRPEAHQSEGPGAGSQQAARDVIGRPDRDPARRPGRAKLAVVGAGALLGVGVAGGAVYAATALSGGGAQPEDVLPANAFAFVKVDLDPAAGQKIAAYRLAQKFPDSGVRGQDSLPQDLVHALLDGSDEKDYDEHVEPWLGKRAGLAVLPPRAGSPDEADVVAAVQYTDRDEARAGLDALAAEHHEPGDQLHYAFAAQGHYVLLGQDQATVDAAAGAPDHLAGIPAYSRGVAALGGDQIALGWLDLGALWKALPEQRRAAAKGLAPTGLLVGGAHVADDAVEVVGRSLGVSFGDSPEARRLLSAYGVGSGGGAALLQGMPADTLAGMSVNGLGDSLSSLYDSMGAAAFDQPEVTTYLRDHGIHLPEDLRALLGTQAAVGVGGPLNGDVPPPVRLAVRAPQPARGVELVRLLLTELAKSSPEEASRVQVTAQPDGYRAGYRAPADPTTAPTLGDTDDFRRALPDAATSGVSVYVDVSRALVPLTTGTPGEEGGLTDRERRNLEPLRAFGYSVSTDPDGGATLRLRVTVKR